MQTFCLYLDDSGTRHPDHDPRPPGDMDWFALGGVLIDESHKPEAKAEIDALKLRWPECENAPLHSTKIRSKTGKFAWLATVGEDKRDAFYQDIDQLIARLPMHAIATVIHRPGYNQRYIEKYGRERWSLCKTAFTVVVERAAKHAMDAGARLRVYVERCNKKTDGTIKGYYDDLRARGHPFDPARASRYTPLTSEDYKATLYEFRTKDKASRLMQIADLMLYPICRGGYDNDYRPLRHFRACQRLIDCVYPGREAERGIKYSCFDQVRAPEKQNPV